MPSFWLVIPPKTMPATPNASTMIATSISADATPRLRPWSSSQRTTGDATAAITDAASTGATIVWVSVSSPITPTTNSVTPTASHADDPRSRSHLGAAKRPVRSDGSNSTGGSSSAWRRRIRLMIRCLSVAGDCPGLQGCPHPEAGSARVLQENARIMCSFLRAHLGSPQVARVVYGAIIGLALVVALEAHPPAPHAVIATLLGTTVAVALAELYSELIGFETVRRRKAGGDEMRQLYADVAAVSFGIAFPAVFFVLAAVDVIADDAAFTIAKWAGLGLIGLYGFAGARLSGAGLRTSIIQATAVALIGAALIGLKAVVH